MKKKVLLLAFIFVVASTSAIASTTVSDISETKLAPGNTFTVQATIYNTEHESKTYKPLTLDLPKGFEIINKPDKGLTELCARCSVERTFKVKVKAETLSGTYQIDLEPNSSYDTGFGQEDTFSIVVDGEPSLFTSMNATEIVQGENSKATLRIRNTGTDTATQTSMRLSMPSARFDPSKLYLGSLKPGESMIKEINIQTSDSISSGPHDIQIKSSYNDELREITEKSWVSVYVQKNAEITVSQIKVENAYIGSKTRVLIELENTGPGEAEKLSSELSCENAEVQNSKAFSGSLDSEETIPTVYQVIPKSNEVNCNVKTSYIDSKKEKSTQSFRISATRNRSDILPLLGGLVVLLVAGFYYWRKRD